MLGSGGLEQDRRDTSIQEGRQDKRDINGREGWSISRKVGYKAIGDKMADALKVGDIIRNNQFFLFPLFHCVPVSATIHVM